MNAIIFTATFCFLIHFSATLRNTRGCEDEKAEYMHLVLPPECTTMKIPHKVCKPSKDPPPFTVHAEVDENKTVKVTLDSEYGDEESIPVSSILLSAEDASKPYVHIGKFVDLDNFEDEELTIWCCNLHSEQNMVSLEKEFQHASEVNFKWLPGDYEGRVAFFATVISGEDCFRGVRSNILTFPQESK